MNNELLEICHRRCLVTDKYIGELKFHSYIENFYGKIFPPRKDSTKTLLEIGIASGGSLLLWEEYFQNATINALDVDEFMHLKFKSQRRIVTKCADAYNKFVIETIPNEYYDIIIDDGPHDPLSQCIFVSNYWEKLAPGGLLIVEDIASDEILSTIGESVPAHLQDKIRVHNTCELDKRFDSRILWIQT
jgi:hypothetical protein